MSSEFEHFIELEITQNSTKFSIFFSCCLNNKLLIYLLSNEVGNGSRSERVIGEGPEWATASRTSAAANDTGQWRAAGYGEC
jgi:hypothetical protein